MLRLFFLGVFAVSAGLAGAGEHDEENCFDRLVSGQTPLKGRNIVECSLDLQATQKADLLEIERTLNKALSDGDAATLNTARRLLEELNPDNANRSLSKSFDQRSALAQIQAQATCTAISYSNQSFGKYIRAVVRPQLTSTGLPASGNGDAVTCNTICSGLEPPNPNSPAGLCFSAMHVYEGHDPMITSEADFTSVGNKQIFTRAPAASLLTHIYEPENGCGHTHFGPNFCCCSN